jgi:hypothetical protein
MQKTPTIRGFYLGGVGVPLQAGEPPTLGIKKPRLFGVSIWVVWEGIEPPTQGFSVLCSTN